MVLQSDDSNEVPDPKADFMATSIVGYVRLSMNRKNGLSLDVQKAAIRSYAESVGLPVTTIYEEVVSGADKGRVEFTKAVNHVKRQRGSVLVVKTLCRLARKASTTLTVVDEIPVIVADNPAMSSMELGIRALVDQEERTRVSQRTKSTIAYLKTQGRTFGTPANLTPEARAKGHEARRTKAVEDNAPVTDRIMVMHESGVSLRQIAKTLNDRGLKTVNGGEFQPTTVKRIIERLEKVK